MGFDSTVLPFTSGTMLSSSPLKKRDGSTQQIQTGLRTVGAGYFAALGQRVVEGREFTAVDSASAQPAAVVNREFSRRYLDGRALGWELPGAENKPAWRIVGVVEDTVRQNVTDPPAPEVYTAAAQQPPYADVINFVIRTRSDPRGVVSIVRATVREAAPGAPIESIQAMEDLVSRSLARPRLFSDKSPGGAATGAKLRPARRELPVRIGPRGAAVTAAGPRPSPMRSPAVPPLGG